MMGVVGGREGIGGGGIERGGRARALAGRHRVGALEGEALAGGRRRRVVGRGPERRDALGAHGRLVRLRRRGGGDLAPGRDVAYGVEDLAGLEAVVVDARAREEPRDGLLLGLDLAPQVAELELRVLGADLLRLARLLQYVVDDDALGQRVVEEEPGLDDVADADGAQGDEDGEVAVAHGEVVRARQVADDDGNHVEDARRAPPAVGRRARPAVERAQERRRRAHVVEAHGELQGARLRRELEDDDGDGRDAERHLQQPVARVVERRRQQIGDPAQHGEDHDGARTIGEGHEALVGRVAREVRQPLGQRDVEQRLGS
jgi:hypothetical protein